MTNALSPGLRVSPCSAVERKNSFRLESDVEEDGLGRYGNDGGFQLLAALGFARVALLKLGENVAKIFSVLVAGWVSGVSGLDMKDYSLMRDELSEYHSRESHQNSVPIACPAD